MAQITFNLAQSARLDCMVPTATVNGGWLPGSLPAGLQGAGMYMIYNHSNNNRYIGISDNLADRFQPRFETVTEFGYSTVTMQQLYLWWGTVTTTNTATILNPNPPAVQVNNFTSHQIDGVSVDSEKVLIAFVMRHFLGGTVTNNKKTGDYLLPALTNNLTVTLNWGVCQAIANGSHSAVWVAGNGF